LFLHFFSLISVSGKLGADSAVERRFCIQTYLSLFLRTCTCAHDTRFYVQVRAYDRPQCAVANEFTSVAFERTCTYCNIFRVSACLRSTVGTYIRTHISWLHQQTRGSVCGSVFFFFLFYLIIVIYLFIIPIFICLNCCY
jgi:hypothetical protein